MAHGPKGNGGAGTPGQGSGELAVELHRGAAKAPERSAIGGFFARLGGLVTDAVLLALFLVVGVAGLNLLLSVIVLAWGVIAPPFSPPNDKLDLLQREESRGTNPRDAMELLASDDYLFAYVSRSVGEAPTYRQLNEAVTDYWLRVSDSERRSIRRGVDAKHFGMAVGSTVLAIAAFIGGLRARRFLLTRLIDASFASFVGKRYLMSRQAGSLVNLVTVVSVLGVSVGVMALVVVISVMDGFDRQIVERMLGVFAHAQVWPQSLGEDSEFSTAEYEEFVAAAAEMDEVVAVSPIIRRPTFFQTRTGINEERQPAVILGLDAAKEREVTRLTREDTLLVGSGDPALRQVVLGIQLARKLDVRLGDRVYALGRVKATGRGVTPKISSLEVVGIFQTGLFDVDSTFAYTTVETVRNLALKEDGFSYFHVSGRGVDRTEALVQEIADKSPYRVTIQPWYDINRDFFEALQVEKVAMFIILLLIVIVASFNIVGTLIMVVSQKTREIGILKSMGASNGQILRIFLFHGVLIGLVGTSLGVACGLWLCRFVARDIEKVFVMPPAVYGMDRLPVVVDPGVILFLAGSALVICVLASIIPSFRASRLNPVEALRYD